MAESGKSGGGKNGGAERKARLAAELRANLKKRKARIRNAGSGQAQQKDDIEKPE